MFPLALKSLWNTRWRYLGLLVPITIGCASVFLVGSSYLLLQSFLHQQAESQVGQNEIIVSPRSNSLAFLLGDKNQNGISTGQIEKIQSIPGIAKIFTQKIIQKPSSVQIDFLGNRFESDAPLILIDPNMLEPELKEQAQSKNRTEIPIFLSKELIGILNSGLAVSLGIPHLNESLLIGRNIKILVGYSSFVPNQRENTQEIPAKIVGFSSRVPLVGLSIPENFLDQLRGSSAPLPTKITSLTLETKAESRLADIQNQIQNLNLDTDSLTQRIGKIQSNLAYILEIAAIFALILIIYTIITIISVISSDIVRQTSFIGLSRCFGATRRDITNLFLAKLSITTTIASLFGIFIGFIVQRILLTEIFSKIASSPIHLPFALSLSFTLEIIVSTFIIVFASSLFPIIRATKISPITALLN